MYNNDIWSKKNYNNDASLICVNLYPVDDVFVRYSLCFFLLFFFGMVK